EKPDVLRAGAQHRASFDPATEREALVALRVVADPPQDVGVDHAAAGGLDPAVATAHPALRIATFAAEAIERDLRRWLGEREVVDAETDLAVAPEDLPCERKKHTLQVGHRELLIDGEAFVLEEDRLADRVGRFVAIAASGYDDPDRGLALLHHTDLHRRGVRPAEERTRRVITERIRDPERLPLLARGVPRRDVERLAQGAFLATQVLHARSFERGVVRGASDLSDRPVRELSQFFARHRHLSREHNARRSSRDEGGPPRYHPCSLLRSRSARNLGR